MGFNIGKTFSNFGKGIKSGFEKFGRNARADLSSAGKFIKDKALPVIEKIASGVATGLKYATPVLGAIAPELLPLAFGASKIAGLIGSGAHVARQGIKQGEQVVSSLKKGDLAGATQAGLSLRGSARMLM